MNDFSLKELLEVFQVCENSFRSVCLLATQLGHQADYNELLNILDIVNSWRPLENRMKRGRVQKALKDLENVSLIKIEQDRIGKADRRFCQITDFGRATLLFLLCSSGYLPIIEPSTLQKAWETLESSILLSKTLSLTAQKLRPYHQLLNAITSRSSSLPTSAKKYFLSWEPKKILGTKDCLVLLEGLIRDQTTFGLGLMSKELTELFPDIVRPFSKMKKLADLIEIGELRGDNLITCRLSLVGLHCLFPLGLMMVESKMHQSTLDPRPLLLPVTERNQINRQLMSNALTFFKNLAS